MKARAGYRGPRDLAHAARLGRVEVWRLAADGYQRARHLALANPTEFIEVIWGGVKGWARPPRPDSNGVVTATWSVFLPS